MIHKNIEGVLPTLRELGGQVPEECWGRIRQVVRVLAQAAEDARILEELPRSIVIINGPALPPGKRTQ